MKLKTVLNFYKTRLSSSVAQVNDVQEHEAVRLVQESEVVGSNVYKDSDKTLKQNRHEIFAQKHVSSIFVVRLTKLSSYL